MREHHILSQYTADIGLECKASSLEELLKACLEGFTEILYDTSAIHYSNDCKNWKIELKNSEFLIIDFLDEVLYLWQTETRLPIISEIKISQKDGQIEIHSLACKVPGKPAIEIKAVTYHDYIFKPQDNEYYARVVFDI
jgi:SHS2 domain-containing protein